MKKLFATLAIAAAAAGLVAAPASAARPSGEERLAKLIEGRTPGEPRGCLYMPGNGNLMVLDKTALVYKSGNKVWVNRTRNPEGIDEDDVLVIRKFGGSSGLCRTDTVTLADRFTGFFTGVLFLDDFVPYEKAS